MTPAAPGQAAGGPAVGPTVGDWLQWRERCALGLCEPGVRRALERFGHARYRRFVARLARTTAVAEPEALTPGPAEAWHRLETHLRLHNTRAGKRYKDWLIARAGSPANPDLEALESGATLLMRDAVRECLRREVSPRWMTALETPAPGDAAPPLTLHDLLPGPLDTRAEVEQRDLAALADAEARVVFERLSPRQRLALLASARDLSLAHPEVTAAARCGKSVLYAAHDEALKGIAAHVRSRFAREDRATLAGLSVRLFERVRDRVLDWGRSENACARLFGMAEGAHAGSAACQPLGAALSAGGERQER
jgi:hypothetical protein